MLERQEVLPELMRSKIVMGHAEPAMTLEVEVQVRVPICSFLSTKPETLPLPRFSTVPPGQRHSPFRLASRTFYGF